MNAHTVCSSGMSATWACGLMTSAVDQEWLWAPLGPTVRPHLPAELLLWVHVYPHVYNLWSHSRSQIPDPNSHSLCRASGLVVCSASDLVPCPRSHSMFSASDLVPSPRSHSMFSASDLVPSPRSHSMFRASGLILRPLGMQSQSSTKIEGSVATMLSNGVSDLLHVYVCTHHIFFVCLFFCLFLCRVDMMAL